MIITKDTDLLAQIDELRADIQNLRDRLTTGVGLPAPGTIGQYLRTDAALPYWDTLPSYVTTVNVTSPITSTGGTTPTLGHATSGVSAGSYTNVNLTVDARGHITAASNGTGGSATWGSITGTLSSQTDLQSALNAKAKLVGGNSFTGTQYAADQFYSTGGGAGFAMESRTTSTVWAMYSTGAAFYFWNSVFGNTFTVSEAGTLSIANVILSGALTLPGSTSQYVRGNGSLATMPSYVGSVAAGNGMNFSTITGSGNVTLGTPSTLTASTTNSASGTTHTHAVTGFLSLGGGTLTGTLTGTTIQGTTIRETSDARFKSDVRAMRDGIEIVRNLLPVRFHNALTDEDEVGLIAQDVRFVLPEVVSTDANGDLAVAYQRLVAPLIAAVQEIDARLSALEKRL